MRGANGAAALPPYRAFSTRIANAYRCPAGASYGVKPTNHACAGWFVSSAVPVFPAIPPAPPAAARPVPDVTTARIAFSSSNVSSGVSTARSASAAGSAGDSRNRGGSSLPWLAIAPATRAIRYGVTSTSPCP